MREKLVSLSYSSTTLEPPQIFLSDGQLIGIGWGGRKERVQGGGTYVHPWLIHVGMAKAITIL